MGRRGVFGVAVCLATLVACGVDLFGTDDAPIGEPADASREGGPSSDAPADANEIEVGGDGAAPQCLATGSVVVDVAYGAKAKFPFGAAAASVGANGIVYAIGKSACDDAGSSKTSIVTVASDGTPSAPLGCFGGDSEQPVVVAPSASGGVLVASQDPTGPGPARVKIRSGPLAGPMTQLDDYAYVVSPPDPRTPRPTLLFEVGNAIVWGGYLSANVGQTPQKIGLLRVRTGNNFTTVLAVQNAEVPVAAAVRANKVVIAFVSEEPPYLVLRRYNLAATLTEDGFSAGDRTKLGLAGGVQTGFGMPFDSIAWIGDTITLATMNGADRSLVVCKETGPINSPFSFVGVGRLGVAPSCDGAVLAAAQVANGKIELHRFVNAAPAWMAPPPTLTMNPYIGFGTASDGMAYVITSSAVARFKP